MLASENDTQSDVDKRTPAPTTKSYTTSCY